MAICPQTCLNRLAESCVIHRPEPDQGQQERTSRMAEVGGRFQRQLTEGEMEQILGAAGRKPDAVLVALWDVILREAEGMSWKDACDRDQKYHVSEYAIPAHQATRIQAALGPKSTMLWFNIGPASFGDGDDE